MSNIKMNMENHGCRELPLIDLIKSENFLYENINKTQEKFYVKLEDEIVADVVGENIPAKEHHLAKKIKKFHTSTRLPICVSCTGTQSIEGFVEHRKTALNAISNGLEKVIINGSEKHTNNTGNPPQVINEYGICGILDGTNTVTCEGATTSYNDLENLEEAIDEKYREEAIFVTSKEGLKSLKGLKDSANELCYKKIYENGKTIRLLNNRRIHISEYYPSPTKTGDEIISLVNLKKALQMYDGKFFEKEVSVGLDGRVARQYDKYLDIDILRQDAMSTLIKK